MKTRILCKLCKSKITALNNGERTDCSCGKVFVSVIVMNGKEQLEVGYSGNRDDYSILDDEDNEITPRESNTEEMAKEVSQLISTLDEHEILKQLLKSLDHQVIAMENWSQAAKFSPSTQQDLLAHLLWTQAAFRTLLQLLQKNQKSPLTV